MVTHRFTSADRTPLCADFYYPSGDSQRIQAGQQGPQGPQSPRGTLVLIHGYCEHRGRYRQTAGDLAARGYQVVAGDLRGHGESGGARAHVQRFSEYLDDLQAILDEVARHAASGTARSPGPPGSSGQGGSSVQGAGGPVVLIGHSMGGLVALRYLQERADRAAGRGPGNVRALVLSSPFFGVKVHVPAWKRLLAELSSRIYPGLTLPNELDPGLLSHDPEVGRAYAADPLVSRIATARWFTEALHAHAEALRRAPEVKLPALVLQAGDDRVADRAASQAVFDRLGSQDKTFTVFPGLYHEVFNEVERDRVLADLISWLEAHPDQG